MKMLKKILFTVCVIITLPLVVALFIAKDYAVEREITIDKPKNEVFDYLKFLKNQDNFSVWATKDPKMKKTFTGTDGTVGFVSAWESSDPELGKGEQEIKKITEGERIDFELRFFEPFESTEPAYLVTETVSENQTKVKWGFSGKMDYPMNLMLLFIDFEKEIGNDFQEGLDKLKTLLEQ
ncbi:SRPBCC family protein [bacterium]|nr:SRPBCC family protein [bacterium]